MSAGTVANAAAAGLGVRGAHADVNLPDTISTNINSHTPAPKKTLAPDDYRGRHQAELARQGKPRLPSDWDSHHRINQKYIDHPDFKDFDFDDPANLRGVQGNRSVEGINIHQQITNDWKNFDHLYPKANGEQIRDFADHTDKTYKPYFWENR